MHAPCMPLKTKLLGYFCAILRLVLPVWKKYEEPHKSILKYIQLAIGITLDIKDSWITREIALQCLEKDQSKTGKLMENQAW